MKKILLYLIFIIILIFSMPIVFTNQFDNTQEVISDTNELFDYGKYNKIKLLHSESGKIEEIELDKYLYGVVASEMPASFELEALKVQAIVSRTYTIYQLENENKHQDADLCDNSQCCQAWISKENRFQRWEEKDREEYWNKIVEAVNLTKGKMIYYEGKIINALFHSNSGGKTELALNVWGGDYPYFKVIETAGEEKYTSYESNVEISKDELIKRMLEKFSGFEIDFKTENPIKIIEYTDGNRVKKIKIGNIEISGVDARKIFELKSANFNFEINKDKVIFFVKGYGHGVGLSQCGSDILAKNGKTAEEIIKYYYNNVQISE